MKKTFENYFYKTVRVARAFAFFVALLAPLSSSAHPKLCLYPDLECPVAKCGRIFTSHDGMRKHFGNLHLRLRYFCTYCNKSYTTDSPLPNHLRNYHLNVNVAECLGLQRRSINSKITEALNNLRKSNSSTTQDQSELNLRRPKRASEHLLVNDSQSRAAKRSRICIERDESYSPLSPLSPYLSSYIPGQVKEIKFSSFDKKLAPYDQLPSLPEAFFIN